MTQKKKTRKISVNTEALKKEDKKPQKKAHQGFQQKFLYQISQCFVYNHLKRRILHEK